MFPAYPMAENVSIGPVPDEFDNEIFYPPPNFQNRYLSTYYKIKQRYGSSKGVSKYATYNLCLTIFMLSFHLKLSPAIICPTVGSVQIQLSSVHRFRTAPE